MRLFAISALLAASVPGALAADVEKAEKLLATTRAAMACNESPALKLFDEKNIKMRLSPNLKELVKLHEVKVFLEGKPQEPMRWILLSPAIGDTSPRYAAVLLAEIGAKLRFAWAPDTAEKSFMILSMMAREWIEIGGRPVELPLFGGFRDEALAERLRVWVGTNMEGFVRERAAAGNVTVGSLIDANAARRKAVQTRIETIYDEIDRAHGHYQGDYDELVKLELELKTLDKDAATLEAYRKGAADFADQESTWLFNNSGRL